MKISAKRSVAMLASTAMLALSAGNAHARADDPAPASAIADAAKGTVTGRVYDEASGKSLRGAIVRVVGGNVQDVTSEDGRFQVAVPAGTVELSIEYVGLDTRSYVLEVAESGNVVAEIGLTSAALDSDEIVVRGFVSGQALAINQQKTAKGIVNIVSEETFGPSPDGNLGYVLQRLPGLSVDTDQDGSPTGINIRGVEGDYNSFQIDGNRVPTSGGGRGIGLTQFSGDGVTTIEVIKAPTPDRDGDAIGGIVNVVTRTAFQRTGREIAVDLGGVYSDLPEKFGHAITAQYSDIFSIGSGDRNLGVSGTLSSYKTNRYSLNRDMDWVQVTPEKNPQLNLGQYTDPVWFMEASHWEYDTRVTNTTTANLNLDFRTDPFNSFYARFFYSNADRRGVKYETDIDIDTRFQDAVGGRKTYAELTPTYGRGTAASRGSRGWIGTEDDQKSELLSINLGGRHEGGDSLLTYDLFYSRNKQVTTNDNELNFVMEPTNPYLLFEYRLVDVSRGEVIINELSGRDPMDLSLVSEGELILNNSVRTEDVLSARADFERKFDLGGGELTLKTGGKYYRSTPKFDQVADVYSMDDAFPYAQVVTPNNSVIMGGSKYFDVNPASGVALLRSNPGLFQREESDSLEDSYFRDYDASERTIAGYAMGTLRFGSHSVIGGVRYEQVDWKNKNYRVSYLNGAPSFTQVEQGDSYGHWLPGLHFRHELVPNLVLRESYSRSYGRPRLSELTEGRFVNEDGDITDGNPTLKPALSDNFDAQLEYYTKGGGLYSVALFYKNIRNFSYIQTYNFTNTDAAGIPIFDPDGDFEYEVPRNGSSAKNYGIELIARQRLSFLPGPLRGLSTSLSATFSDSEAKYPNRTDNRALPVPGFSKVLFTASLEWVWGGFQIRGDYIYRSNYVEGLGDSVESDEFYAAEQRVDLTAGYAVTKNLRAYASVTNLTDQPQVSYSGYRPFVEDASLTGRKFRFGVQYKF
ncbi:MAG: TonB-dependent receptor [Sphingomonadales bacterium]|nr:MAG: TonB-dependent receptor [Sphingomonadales bacterium]